MRLPTPPGSDLKKDYVCVGIVVSDPLRSIGLQSILEDSLKLRTCLLADGNKFLHPKPTILILEGSHGGEMGLSAPLRHMLLHMPGVAIVLLTRGDEGGPTSARQALAAGARAVLPETAQLPEIRACLRAVLRGRTWMPRQEEAQELAAKPSGDTPGDTEVMTLAQRFTPKEREVLRWLSQGQSNREIAKTMGIDEATVKAHLGRMLRKAGASNRVELTLRALASEKGRTEKS